MEHTLPSQSKALVAAMILGNLILIFFAIWLFFMREDKVNDTVPHQVIVPVKKASKQIVKGEFLVLFTKKGIRNYKNIINPLKLEFSLPILSWILVKRSGLEPSYIDLDSEEANEDRTILTSLLEHPEVLDAQHNFVMDAAISSTNAVSPGEWHSQAKDSHNMASPDLPNAWEISRGSSKVSIAIIDDFIFNDAFLFQDRFSACMDRVQLQSPLSQIRQSEIKTQLSHGELMLLSVGACINQGPYSAGTDWQAQLNAVQRSSKGHAQTFLAALFASGIDVCESSAVPCQENRPEKPQGKNDVILLPEVAKAPDLLQFSTEMALAMAETGAIVVCAAGNDAEPASSFFPGATPGTINVGSVNRNGERSSFSNWGPSVDLFAPGSNILFTYKSGPKLAEGTSFSAAIVAGGVALLKSLIPSLTFKEALYYLTSASKEMACNDYCKESVIFNNDKSCTEICCSGPENICGAHILDLKESLLLAQTKNLSVPLIDVNKYFFVLSKNDLDIKNLDLTNVGQTQAHVRAISYDDNILISPNSAEVRPGKSVAFSVKLKKEPFTRKTYKVDFVVENSDTYRDRSEIYIEYIPKR
jgi:hypothetical protein